MSARQGTDRFVSGDGFGDNFEVQINRRLGADEFFFTRTYDEALQVAHRDLESCRLDC